MRGLEDLLVEVPNFFVDVIESLSEGLIITDQESAMLYVNDQTCAITGYGRSELLGTPATRSWCPLPRGHT